MEKYVKRISKTAENNVKAAKIKKNAVCLLFIAFFLAVPGNASDAVSNALAQKANERLSEGHDEITLRHAFNFAENALIFNQHNEAALLAKDRILTLLGSRLTAALVPEDEALYEWAVSALQRGNLLEAKMFSEKLVQKPANRSVWRVAALKERLDSLL
jgi:hypothetical protein